MYVDLEQFRVDTLRTGLVEPSCCEFSTKPKNSEAMSMAEEAKRLGIPEGWCPPVINGEWGDKSFISVEQLTAGDIGKIVNMAAKIRDTRSAGRQREMFELATWLFPHAVTLAFYEPSTRTASSFVRAAELLGLNVNPILDMVRMSSFSKGETVADNAQVLGAMYPLLIQRHPDVGAAAVAAYAAQFVTRCDGSRPRVINAGDGVGEHPTQALLDITTIIWERRLRGAEGLKRLNIGMLGDLKHGRTVHSLTKALNCLGGPQRFYFISPEQLAMPEKTLEVLLKTGQDFVVTEDLSGILPDLDVLYVTRIQNERFTDPAEYLRYESLYRITPQTMEDARPGLTLMHPLPRRGEISAQVDRDPRAAYFRQVENGVDVRMALLCCMFDRSYPNLRP